jgi:hypothetical protein
VVVVSDYIDGYLDALHGVMTEIEVEQPDSVNGVRYLIRHMIDDCGSE